MKSIISNTAAAAFLFGAALVPGVTAKGLGINCNGSNLCAGGKDDNLIALRNIVNNIDPNRRYFDGEHIVCSAGVDELVVEVFLCAFLQNTGADGAVGSEIPPLLDALIDHNCELCGSVPVGFVSQGDNNPDDFGILTVNAVSDPQGCEGLC